jgi:thiol-disulfide isomerase/thioredoxin
MIEPVFEELAREKAKRGGEGQVAFAKVDLGVGMGSMVAREYGIAATPTFGFFLDGKKVSIRFHPTLFLPSLYLSPTDGCYAARRLMS